MTLYYIEDANIYMKNVDEERSKLPVHLGENIIEIQNDEQRELLIRGILSNDFVEDKRFKKYIDENLPMFSKAIKNLPINLDTLKEELQNLFDTEVPDGIFENKSFVDGMKAFLNFFIRKRTATFYAINIQNGKLRYDTKYLNRKHYAFYFKLIKLNDDLDEIVPFFMNMQRLIERTYLHDIYFAPRENITHKGLKLFQESHNLIIGNIVLFRYSAENIREKVLSERRYVKRAKVNLPREYWVEEKMLLEKIDIIVSAISVEIENADKRKKAVEQLLKDTSAWEKIKSYGQFLELLNIKNWFD